MFFVLALNSPPVWTEWTVNYSTQYTKNKLVWWWKVEYLWFFS